MRIEEKIVDINYKDTKCFFNGRAKKYKKENPYAVTMYQDNNALLVEQRNKDEQQKIMPLLQVNENSRIIDIGCGIGRWSEAIKGEINSYWGIDFSEDLIKIARGRNYRQNIKFDVLSATDILNHKYSDEIMPFNIIIISGVLLYLNDEDVKKVISAIDYISTKNAIIYIREPVGIEHRLTLKEFFSEELDDYYNAIYRTKEEYENIFNQCLKPNKFKILKKKFLFDQNNDLNNRVETSQFYFIITKFN